MLKCVLFMSLSWVWFGLGEGLVGEKGGGFYLFFTLCSTYFSVHTSHKSLKGVFFIFGLFVCLPGPDLTTYGGQISILNCFFVVFLSLIYHRTLYKKLRLHSFFWAFCLFFLKFF